VLMARNDTGRNGGNPQPRDRAIGQPHWLRPAARKGMARPDPHG
jgi:hypothetical protein